MMSQDVDPDRNPFVCRSCGNHYSSSLSSNNVPCHLNSCTHTMCMSCVKKNLEVIADKSAGIFCCTVTCLICQKKSTNNGTEPMKAHSFIEILLEIENLKSQSKDCVQITNSSALKCEYCKTIYSSLSHTPSSPCTLHCGHSMCAKCFEARQIERSEESRNKFSPSLKYNIRCNGKKCRYCTLFTDPCYDMTIQDVILWLERKDLLRNDFLCLDCAFLTPCARGFVCTECTHNDENLPRLLCGFCTQSLLHKGHTFESIPNTMNTMKDKCGESEGKVMKGSSEANDVLDKSKLLIGWIEKNFLSVSNPATVNYADVLTITHKLKRKADEYSKIMEEIVSSNRTQNKRLEDLISEFIENFPEVEHPQLTVASVESKGDEEKADKKTDGRKRNRKRKGKGENKGAEEDAGKKTSGEESKGNEENAGKEANGEESMGKEENAEKTESGESKGAKENAGKDVHVGESTGDEESAVKIKIKREPIDEGESMENKRFRLMMGQGNVKMECMPLSSDDTLPFQY